MTNEKEELRDGQVVSTAIATAEINKWLDSKKIGGSKRAKYKHHIAEMVSAVEDGYLKLDENLVLHQTLKFPFKEEVTTENLTYKPRMSGNDRDEATKHSDGSGSDIVYCFGAFLTGKVKAFLKKLDSEDHAIMQAVVMFFM